jgi:transcriptional regulator with XRE-family HTH domain
MKTKRDRHFFTGLRVGYLRRREGFGQAELAKDIGLSRDQLSSIESGRVPLKLYVGWKLCYLLGTHPDWLWRGGDEFELFPILPAVEIKRLEEIFLANKNTPFADGWGALGALLRDAEKANLKQDLTNPATSVKHLEVKAQLPSLLERLNRATKETGKMSALANFLGQAVGHRVPLASVSRWLAGKREPGGQITLLMLHWVERQERQK